MQTWRVNKKPLLGKSPTPATINDEHDLAIVMPSGDVAPIVCGHLLRVGRPFACMVPSDLVAWKVRICFRLLRSRKERGEWILTVIDLFSREVQFIPLFTRTAEEVLKTLLARVIFDKGVPSVFMSDEAAEFVGKLMKGLCSALGIKQMTTKAYNPRGNSICETVHKFLGSCLTSLPVDQRPAWPDRLGRTGFKNLHLHTTLPSTTPSSARRS